MTVDINARHLIAEASYNPARKGWYGFKCSCGVLVTAPQDEAAPSLHQPLVDAWSAHRAKTPRVKEQREARQVWRQQRAIETS